VTVNDETRAEGGMTEGATCGPVGGADGSIDEREAALLAQIAMVVNDDWDLGEVARVERIFGGYCNASFAVWTRRDDGEHLYFVRKYNPAITEREVRFEHALLSHVDREGFGLASHVYPTRSGPTFVTRDEIVDGVDTTFFFAVFTMLIGEDKYTWLENRLTDKEFDSGARVLARFHHASFAFDPGDLARVQPPIIEFVPTWAQDWPALIAGGGDTACDRYLRDKLPGILGVVARGAELDAAITGMPTCATHCDYHPGNLKWVDEQGVGLFDFDWAKVDYRLFDVAQGICYFCTSWEGPDKGTLRIDKAEVFLRGYQDEASRWDHPGRMGAEELALLPRMIADANLYILNWDVTYFYGSPDSDVDEYLGYFVGQVSCMEHIEEHMDELAAMAARCA
jgi:homoserine kinase type II